MSTVDPLTSRWAVALCIVTFDIDEGPRLEFCEPPGVFDPQQEREFCHLALPDSNTQKGDCIFSFRLTARRDHGYVRAGCPLYGFVFFHQDRSQDTRRGCAQSSLVLLSKWPFVHLFKRAVRLIAVAAYRLPMKLKSGPAIHSEDGAPPVPAPPTAAADTTAVVTQAYAEIATWPVPEIDGVYELPLLTRQLPFRVPCYMSEALADNTCPCLTRSLSDTAKDPVPTSDPSVQRWKTALPRDAEIAPLRRCQSAPASPSTSDHIWAKPKTPGTVDSLDLAVRAPPAVDADEPEDPIAGELEEEMRSPMRPRGRDSPEGAQYYDAGETPADACAPAPCAAFSPRHGLSPSDDMWQVARLEGRQCLLDDINVYVCFRYQLRTLWKLWELVALGRPVLLYTPTPAAASDCVLAALALIAPLAYAGDPRPVFTLQDPDFRRFEACGSAEAPMPPALLGITNPYIAKRYGRWRNFITVSRRPLPLTKAHPRSLFSMSWKAAPRDTLQAEFQEIFTSEQPLLLDTTGAGARALLAALLPPTPGADPRLMEEVNNNALRRHFLGLTERVLEPLRRCFERWWASSKLPFLLPPSAYKPHLPPALFLQGLRFGGVDAKLFKGGHTAALAFYKAFLEGPNFDLWLKETVQRAVRTHLLTQDVAAQLATCTEGQRVEAYAALAAQREAERHRPIVDRLLLDRLQGLVDHMETHLLPRHTTAALSRNPSPFL